MNHGRMMQRQTHFVALQLTDQMPVDLWQQNLSFRQLLRTVFSKHIVQLAEILNPGPIRILGDRDDLDILWSSTRTLAGIGNLLLTARKIFLQDRNCGVHSRLQGTESVRAGMAGSRKFCQAE